MSYCARQPDGGGFNGSTVGGPWLTLTKQGWPMKVSELQWVHGRGTVVNACGTKHDLEAHQLQWVHGRGTVVNHRSWSSCRFRSRRFNGSTVGGPWLTRLCVRGKIVCPALQWVHGRGTVVN